VVIAGGLFLARSQETVQDVSYMRGHDPSPFDRHPHQRKGRDLGPESQRARR
jgi:hypothetical protein